MENVLLMDEDVWNQTIPVILCDEEDVEGNHGASIGNIDEELLFYMKSRGIEEKAVYEMMAGALIESVAAKIPDEKTKEELLND
jgi:Fe-S cluster assembly scaffold protein SufB